MRKLAIAFMLSILVLSGCGREKVYSIPEVKVIEKKEVHTPCRGTCYDFYVTVEKDGNKYTYEVNSNSYKLAEVGSVVDLAYYSDTVLGDYASLSPVGVQHGQK